jgi:hypothetical protein
MVTNLWLDAALKAAQGRNRPELLNSEGDPLDFTTLHFPLLPGVKPEQVRKALAAIPALRQENPSFWNWLDEAGMKPKTAPRRGKAQTFFSTMEDGSLVLGTLVLLIRLGRSQQASVSKSAMCTTRFVCAYSSSPKPAL